MIARASEGVGSSIGRMFQRACVPYCAKAWRYRIEKSSGSYGVSFMMSRFTMRLASPRMLLLGEPSASQIRPFAQQPLPPTDKPRRLRKTKAPWENDRAGRPFTILRFMELYGSPQPPPPGVSMRTVAPAGASMLHLPGNTRSLPLSVRIVRPQAPGAPPCNP